MENSILNDVKKLLGILPDYTEFDQDVIIDINSVFNILYQLGVGPAGFSISDSSTTWSAYIGDSTQLNMVKTYIYLKVRLMFDPPPSSALTSSIEKQIAELEWRLNAQVDPEME